MSAGTSLTGWGSRDGVMGEGVGVPEPFPTIYIQVQYTLWFIHSFIHSFLSTCSQLTPGDTREVVTVLVPKEYKSPG